MVGGRTGNRSGIEEVKNVVITFIGIMLNFVKNIFTELVIQSPSNTSNNNSTIVSNSDIDGFFVNSKTNFQTNNIPFITDINSKLAPDTGAQSTILTGSGILFQLLDHVGPGIYELIVNELFSIIITPFSNELPISMDDNTFMNLIKTTMGISSIGSSIADEIMSF